MREPATAPILIVDDSSTMRTILRDMLRNLGFRNLDEAADGQSALAKVRDRSFALIISDWHMEPMTGIELLRQVRRVSTPGANRFIMATTERSWGSQTTAKVDGVDGFLVKPFTIEALRAKVDAVLRR